MSKKKSQDTELFKSFEAEARTVICDMIDNITLFKKYLGLSWKEVSDISGLHNLQNYFHSWRKCGDGFYTNILCLIHTQDELSKRYEESQSE